MKTEAEIRQLKDNMVRASKDPKLRKEARQQALLLAGCLIHILGDYPGDSPTADVLGELPLQAARFKLSMENDQ